MCTVCDQVKDIPTDKALSLIAAKVDQIGLTTHLSKLMDKVLDTQVESTVDVAAEAKAFRAMKAVTATEE